MLKAGAFLQNRYEIIYRIGSGGMADVYKAKDHKLNRFVAVKVLKQEFRDDTAFLSKFRVEAQAAAGMSHPNIVNVFDVGEDRGISFIVMELVEGITLKAYISKKGRLSVREATSIALQVAAGLEAAHNNGIVHRDVKPQNILISMDGKAKVSDFGIARTVNANTVNSGAMGSVHYSSPEQTRGGYSDAKSDIYSVGITMFEMVTGRVPFDGDTTVEVALKHLQEEIPSPRKFAPEIPFATEQIILKCTQKSPDRRYANMPELIRDLKESLVNPNGNFVTIRAVDRKAQTVMLSREEMNHIKNSTLPTYDSSFDTGAAGSMSGSGADEVNVRDYARRGSYYQDSSYQKSRLRDTSPVRAYDHPDRQEDLYDDDPDEFDDDYTIDDPERLRRRRSRPDMIVVGVIILAAIAIALGVLIIVGRATGMIGDSGSNDVTVVAASTSVQVPDLVGKSEAEAQKELSDLSLGYKYQGESPSSEYEKGLIVSQSVDAGASVDKNTTIGYVISSGSEESLKVPDLTGYTQEEAESALTALGLKVVVDTSRYSDSVDQGLVITTNPGAGSTVVSGDTVTLYISQGKDNTMITVLDVEGKYQSDAVTALTNQGLYVFTTEQSSDTVAEGLVISQNIEAGSSVPTGTSITLTVSTGTEDDDEAVVILDDTDSAWYCNAQLNEPENFNGEPVRITLVQGDTETVIFEGLTTFPYILNVQGQSGVSTGTVFVYTLDASTWEVIQTTTYNNVMFTEVDG